MNFWAKVDKDTKRVHLLLYHMIDVGQVALALWNLALSDSIRLHIAQILKVNIVQCGKMLAFLASLHDLGKASPAFQRKYPDSIPTLEDSGLKFPSIFTSDSTSHGIITAWALEPLLIAYGFNQRLSRKTARALGGHHGIWPDPISLQPPKPLKRDTGDEKWDDSRERLFLTLKEKFDPPTPNFAQLDQTAENTYLVLLSGFLSVCDWLGSRAEYFTFVDQPGDQSVYFEKSAQNAQKAILDLGWVGWKPDSGLLEFPSIFGFTPYQIQSQVIEQNDTVTQPCLIILEAPTGIGKTETALYLADCWMKLDQQRGIYIAMPTQATSNQMFERVKKYLQKRYPKDLVNLHLAHSQAGWNDQIKYIELISIGENGQGRVIAMTWFLPRKRTLLAPFAVGTVDQSLLSVLQTKHFFVRLFGLSHKTVIFDEVHAYDTYMSTIFQRLLAWLHVIGTSVVILSATLPAKTRTALVSAYSGVQNDIPSYYPSLTIVDPTGVKTIQLVSTPDRKVTVEWIDPSPESISAYLKKELASGGCAAVICNTVGRAQEVYKFLSSAGIVSEENLVLFHARFPAIWRNEIEKEVLSRFQKDGKRPHKAILVATQVIEQSLDLDFDFMITDLAPIDLILQRVGRLHRHERTRPPGLSQPLLAIAKPEMQSGVPSFNRDKHVYDEFILMTTFLTIRDKKYISLPAHTVELIEAVYGDSFASTGLDATTLNHLENLRQKMISDQHEAEFIARTKLIADPKTDTLLSQTNLGLEEDDPQVHQALRALTRLADPGVALVCLHQTHQGLVFDPTIIADPIDLEKPPTTELVKLFLQYTVQVQNHILVNHFLGQEPPKAWKDVPALRYHRLVVFTHGVHHVSNNYSLHLDRKIGLFFQKEVP